MILFSYVVQCFSARFSIMTFTLDNWYMLDGVSLICDRSPILIWERLFYNNGCRSGIAVLSLVRTDLYVWRVLCTGLWCRIDTILCLSNTLVNKLYYRWRLRRGELSDKIKLSARCNSRCVRRYIIEFLACVTCKSLICFLRMVFL